MCKWTLFQQVISSYSPEKMLKKKPSTFDLQVSLQRRDVLFHVKCTGELY